MNNRLFASFALTVSLGFAQVPYPGNDADYGVSRNIGLDPYTGNYAFASRDLQVAGPNDLSWIRYANSRTTQSKNLFGMGHNWAHSSQWEMVDAGRDGQGRALLLMREPTGKVHQFTETTPGQWTAAPSVRDRLVSNGDAFRVLRPGTSEVHFTRTQDRFTLDKLVDPSGNIWKFSWENGLLAQITEPAGRWLKVTYDTITPASKGAASFTVVTQVSASDGQTVRYSYEFLPGEGDPVLTAVAYPDGTIATYTYVRPREGDRLLLAQATDPRGDSELRGRIFHYHSEPEAAAGQVLKITTTTGEIFQSLVADTKGGERSYEVKENNGAAVYQTYNVGGNLAEGIDALGFAKKHSYDAGGRGFKVTTTDELGRITRFENDAQGNILKTTYPDGTVKSWQRDDRGRVLAETDELGQTRRYFRDARGRVTRVQHPEGSTEEATYNEFGQPLTRKDRGGAVTTMTYDARGLRTKITNAVGATTTYAYDARDRIASTTDVRGNTTRFERNAAGRVTRTTFADGTSIMRDYDAFGQVTKIVDAAGAVSTMVYDEFGRLTATVNAKGERTDTIYAKPGDSAPFERSVGNATASGRLSSTSYDAVGRVSARTVAVGTKEAATTRTSYDATGKQISATNPLGKTVQFFHDERGRRTKTMSALNHATTAAYDAVGRKLSETDAKGNTTRWTYDAMGRELTKTDARGQVTRREYNAAGRLVALTDAKLNTYRYEYDLLGRQTALVYPDGSRESTAYDATGLKVGTTNRAGTVRTFTYDNRNREISSEWSDSSQKIVKAYDAAGRMTLEDNGVSKLTFAYDEAGRLASETQDLSPAVTDGASDPVARVVSYTYNADGQSETLGYPDGSFVKFAYNARGQLAEILGDGIPPPIASYEYDAAGNATLMPRANDTETAREFDAENKTLAITDRVSGRRSPLSELDYTYDEAGNRTATLASVESDGRGAKKETLDTYRYDETYQVTGADYGATVQGSNAGAPALTEKFTYDAVGNRIEVGRVAPHTPPVITRYTVNSLNQYTQVGEFAPTHDRNGNLSGMGQWLYRYDALNRLVFASNGTTTARFYYDAKNRCVARSYQSAGSALQAPSSTLTLNTYDNWNLVEERDGSGAQQARYVHGRKIDEIIVMVNRHGTFYPHHDALGNVTMLTGKDGRLVERYTYSVTGQVAVSDAAGKGLTESAVGNRWMFTGREWLQEVGLYDYRNRVYSAELGRFLQTDPILFLADDVNIYRYVSNRYLTFTDPHGWQEVRVYMTNGDSGAYSHIFTQSIDSGNNSVTQGLYPSDPNNPTTQVIDDSSRIGQSNTELLASYTVTDAQVQAVRQSYVNQDGQWTKVSHNCGDASDQALDVAGIERTADASLTVEIDTALNLLAGFFGGFWNWLVNLFE